MKKKFTIKTLLLLLVVALASGCMKVELRMKISNSDVELSYIYGIADQYKAYLTGEDPFGDATKEMKDAGLEVSDYSADGYTGVKATKKLGSLADLSTEENIGTVELKLDELTGLKLFKIESKGFFKTKYTASIKTNAMDDVEKYMDTSTLDDEDEEEEDDDVLAPDEADDLETTGVVTTGEDDDVLEMDDDSLDLDTDEDEDDDDDDTTGFDMSDLNKLTANMDVSFKVELPSTSSKNNATSVDGKVLTWDLTKFTGEALEFDFEVLNMTNIILVCGGALLLLLIIVGIIIVATKKKKKPAPVEFADKPIPEVVKNEAVTPINPTSEPAPAVATVEEKKEEVVEVEAPKIEEETPVVEIKAAPPVVSVGAPKEPEVKVETPAVDVTTPEEAKTE